MLQAIFFSLFVRPFLTFFVGLRIAGAENLPKTDPFVMIANHTSHLDALTLLSLFPLSRLRNVRPCAAADYFESTKMVSWVSHTFLNILGIRRTNITRETHPVFLMKACLSRGESLILFPEGTRGSGEEISSFKTGIAHLIEEAPGIQILPVFLKNLNRSLPKGEFIPIPVFCDVRIGAPMTVQGSRQKIVRSLEEAVKALAEG